MFVHSPAMVFSWGAVFAAVAVGVGVALGQQSKGSAPTGAGFYGAPRPGDGPRWPKRNAHRRILAPIDVVARYNL
jgi:hypothetical protein